jgi:predicted lactoylglutathione lyase
MSSDVFADAALEAGGSPANEPLDDGTGAASTTSTATWEVMWMSPEAFEQAPGEAAQTA